MRHINDVQFSDEARVSHQPTPSTRIGRPANEFQRALGEVVKLVNSALGRGRIEAATAYIRAHLPELIAGLGSHLPTQLLHVGDHAYRRVELHQCPIAGYQILAMVWGPGQRTPIHDHDDLWGIEAVLLGELQVVRYQVTELAGTAVRLRAHSVAELPSGGIETIDAEHGLHLCRNPSQRQVAVSLHIYSQPLDRYGVFDDQCDGWHTRRAHFPPLETLVQGN